jgi:hypothetical protein
MAPFPSGWFASLGVALPPWPTERSGTESTVEAERRPDTCWRRPKLTLARSTLIPRPRKTKKPSAWRKLHPSDHNTFDASSAWLGAMAALLLFGAEGRVERPDDCNIEFVYQRP